MSALDDFVVKSATSYLQSVVFVDDEIYINEKPRESTPIRLGSYGGLIPQFTVEGDDDGAALSEDEIPNKNGEITPPKEPSEEESVFVHESDAVESPSYHPRELMESFAKEGIICALYEPRQGFTTDTESVLFRLCERADVVILDWDLYKDDGDGVSTLLTELIKKSESELPHHVRLCAIYTTRPSLQPVMDSLLAKLRSHGCSVDVVPEKLQLIAGATRISIFGKPVTVGRPAEDKDYEITESNLADKVIKEFSDIHSGLMPAFALHGLAAVRRNTKRLLDTFSSDLDGAFLLHRALVLGDGDAFDELPELLSDEIRAVLEETWPMDTPISAITESTVSALSLADPNPTWKTTQGQPFDAKSAFRELLLRGEKGLNDARVNCSAFRDLKPGGVRGIKPNLLKDFETILTTKGKSGPEHLAALFCNRTQYGSDDHRLDFGTIVRHKLNEEDSWDYSVCLMPTCDSRRIDNATCTFPFWKLRTDVKCGHSGKRNGLVVIDPEGSAHCLTAGGKIRDMLWLHKFTPDTGLKAVIAKQTDKKFQFAADGIIIEWVAELKPLHAQRIAAYLGAEVSRVGLVESEWIRLFCDR